MLKSSLISIFNKFLQQELIQKTLLEQYQNFGQELEVLKNQDNPYHPIAIENHEQGKGVIFVTGRFRSGSTLLWNLFRQSDQFTAYYEPFNERQWFNPITRGGRVDDTHRGVKDYWKEYEGLDKLTAHYDENWIRECLFMNHKFDNAQMKAFIDTLIAASKARPVLQFNRIDFRLPWIKKHYPLANIVHLFRNPRDQWCSILTDKELMNKDEVQRTYVDNFYLDVWCNDLCSHYPFLHKSVTPHPYKRFFYLWKLSYLFGLKYACFNVAYEDLVKDPTAVVKGLGQHIGAGPDLHEKAQALISVTSIDAWRDYAEAEWFIEKEKQCEDVLNAFLNT